VVVFFEESFDSALGAFTVENGCGPTPPAWSNNAGYAHAAELAALGISSIYTPAIVVPTGVSNVRLRMRHKHDTEYGYDGGQLLVSINSGPLALVANFTEGPYTQEGAHPNPETCMEYSTPSWWPAWSGPGPELESEVALSAAPFNVVPGDTVSIRFRMLVDSRNAGNGWDIDWVRLTASSR
jgi:hypothetical protein